MIEKFTDPATELVALCEKLRDTPAENSRPTLHCLGRILNYSTASPSLMVMIGVIATQFERVKHLVENYEDLDVELRNECIRALETLSKCVNPTNFNKQWDIVKKETFLPEALTAVKYTGNIIRPTYQLRQLSDEEKSELVNELTSVVAEIEDQAEVSIYEAIAVDALKSTIEILERFDFSGREYIFERVSASFVKLRAAAEHAPSEKEQRNVLKALAVLGTIFASGWGMLATYSEVKRETRNLFDDVAALHLWTQELGVEFCLPSMQEEPRLLPPPIDDVALKEDEPSKTKSDG